MATTLHSVIGFPAAALAFGLLISCGGDQGSNTGSDAESAAGGAMAQARPLFPDNFKGVCSGAPVSTAAAYVPGSTGNKALYFATHRDDLTDRSSSLPGDWTVQFSSDSDALRAINLVVCARRTAAREARICDGYENDGRATQNRVRWHTATYDLSVREARTGRTLAETTLEAASSNCPMFMRFDGDSDTVDAYASPSDSAVADFLRPHIAP